MKRNIITAAVAGQLARHSPYSYEPKRQSDIEIRMALVNALGAQRACAALGIDLVAALDEEREINARAAR